VFFDVTFVTIKRHGSAEHRAENSPVKHEFMMNSSSSSVFFTCCFLSVLTLELSGQVVPRKASFLRESRLEQTITYVQLLGLSEFDKAMRDAFVDWDLTSEVVFVQPGEFKGDIRDPAHTFFKVTDYKVDGVNSAGMEQDLNHVAAVFTQGGKGLIAACSLDHFGHEKGWWDISWRLPLVVGSIAQCVNYVAKNDPKVGMGGFRAEDLPLERVVGMKDRTLLIRKDWYTEKELSKLVKVYPHRLEFVDVGTIEKVIADKDPNYGVLTLVHAYSTELLIYDPFDRTVLYAERGGRDSDLMRSARLDRLLSALATGK
jgi:hypothetical protein